MYNDKRKNKALIRKIAKTFKNKLRRLTQPKYQRIPRKLKKKYKTKWEKHLGVKITIQRSSIAKRYWGGSIHPVWGCVTNYKQK